MCIRDSSPGEFYQLDFEMSFATQEDVLKVGEEVLTAAFKKFAPKGYTVTEAPYPIISYNEAMLKYGTDKPVSYTHLSLRKISTIDYTEYQKIGTGKLVQRIENGSSCLLYTSRCV